MIIRDQWVWTKQFPNDLGNEVEITVTRDNISGKVTATVALGDYISGPMPYSDLAEVMLEFDRKLGYGEGSVEEEEKPKGPSMWAGPAWAGPAKKDDKPAPVNAFGTSLEISLENAMACLHYPPLGLFLKDGTNIEAALINTIEAVATSNGIDVSAANRHARKMQKMRREEGE